MSIRWIESFGVNASVDPTLRKYAAGTVCEAGTTFVAGRFGGLAMRADPGTFNILRSPVLASGGGLPSWTCGMAFRASSGAIYEGGSWWLFRWLDSSDLEQITLRIVNGQTGYAKLRVTRGTDIVIESDEFPIPTEWNYVEWAVTAHGSAGTVEVRLNHDVVISLSGINTSENGDVNTYSAEFGCGSSVGQTFDICDIYATVNDASADTDLDGFLGAVCAVSVFPTSDEDPSEMTPSAGTDKFAVVDDPATTAAPETDYNEGATGEEQFHGLDRLSGIEGDVLGVQIDNTLFLDGAGSETLTSYHRRKDLVAAQSMGASAVVSTTPDVPYLAPKQADPYSGFRFHIDDIEQGQVGVGVS